MRDFLTDKRQVISTKNVIDILRGDSYQLRTKSVLKPCAQIASKCEPVTQLQYTIQAYEMCRQYVKSQNIELYYLVTLQFENALRISEVINITPYQIDSFGNVCINTLKKSKPKIIPAGECREFLLQCKKSKVCPFAHYNRFFIYRIYKKFNLMMSLPNRQRFAVTHSARHLTAMSAREASFNEESLQSHLSHKSQKSTNRYGK